MPMKVTTLRLTDRVWQLLEDQARAEGTSASQLIREGAMMRVGYALGKRADGDLPRSSLSGDPFTDFESAAREVLDMLHERLGFSLWLVSRIEGEEWVIEHARDEGYGVKAGDSFHFADTYCARMLGGEGPSFAPDSRSIPCYASAGLGQELPIAAYVGVPLIRADGSVFGTLCAIDPAPQPADVGDHLALVELGGRTLSSLLEWDAEKRRN